MFDTASTFSYVIQGIANVMFYDPPYITDYHPKFLTVHGGQGIFIKGENFDMSLGGIYCMFNT